MKKILIMTAFLTLFFLSPLKVKADNAYNEDWVNWNSHDLGDPQFPFVGYGQLDNVKPWYSILLQDTGGITIKYGNDVYLYLTFNPSPTKFGERNNYVGGWSNWGLSTLQSNSPILEQDGTFQRLFSFSKPVYYWQGSRSNVNVYNVDLEVTSSQDLYNKLESYNWKDPAKNDSGDLPFLSYDLQRKYVPVASINVVQTKEIFTWNYAEKEPYKSNAQNYSFDIAAWANFKTYNSNEIWDADNLDKNDTNLTWLTQGGQNISVNQFSFLYQDIGKAVYSRSGKSFVDDSTNSMALGYVLGIRTRNNEGTQFSYWKLYKVQAGGYVISTGKVMKPDGSVVDTQADQGNDNFDTSHQGSGNQIVQYSTDNSNSAEEDTTSTVYDGDATFSIGTVIATLKALVNSISELPQIMAQLLSVLPPFFVSIFVIGLTLLIAIGIIKMVVQ